MEKPVDTLHGFVIPDGVNNAYVVGASICDAEVYDTSILQTNAFQKQMVLYEIDSLVLERAEDIHGSFYYVIRDYNTDPSNKFKLNEVIRGYNDYARWISQQGMGAVKLGPTRKLNIFSIDTVKKEKAVVDTTISYQIPSGMEGASTTLPREIMREEISKYIDPSVRDRLLLTSTDSGYRASPYRRFVDYFPTYTLFQGLCNNDPELVAISLYKGGSIKLLLQMKVVIKNKNQLICRIIYNHHRLSGLSICGVDSLLDEWLSSDDLKTPLYEVPDHVNYPSLRIDPQNEFIDYIPLNKPPANGKVAIWKTTFNIRLIMMCYPLRIFSKYIGDVVNTFKDDISTTVYKAFTEFIVPYYEGKDINWGGLDRSKLDEYETDNFSFNIDGDLVSALLWISIILGDSDLLSKLDLGEDVVNGVIDKTSRLFIAFEFEDSTIHPVYNHETYSIIEEFTAEIYPEPMEFSRKNISLPDAELTYDDILSFMIILDPEYKRLLNYTHAILKNLTSIEKMEKVRDAIDTHIGKNDNVMLTIPLIMKNIPLEKGDRLPYGFPLSVAEDGEWY